MQGYFALEWKQRAPDIRLADVKVNVVAVMLIEMKLLPHNIMRPMLVLNISLGFVVPYIFKYSNKNTQPDATINHKMYCLVIRRCSTCFRYYYAQHQELFQTAIAASGFHINAECIMMLETC
jgi:hypothetical protein